MAKKNNKIIKKAVESYEILTGNEEVKKLAEIKLMSDLEEQSALATARANGEAQWLKEWRKLGLEKGEKPGLEKGKLLGIQEEKEKIIIKLLHENVPMDTISKITDLNITEIKKIQAKHK